MSNLRDTITANNLKRIEKRLTEGLSRWDGTHNLTLEHTRFVPAHGLNRDTNGDTLGATLRTDLYAVEALRLIRYESRYDAFELYARLETHPDLRANYGFKVGLTSDTILVRYRNEKGKVREIHVPSSVHSIDSKESFYSDLSSRLGGAFDASVEKPEVYHEKDMTPEEEEKVDFIWKEYQNKKLAPYRDLCEMIRDARRGGEDILKEVTELFASKGLKFIEVFEYNFHESFWSTSTEFISESANSLEIGAMSNSTYSSHPIIFKLTRSVQEPKTVKLVDLGAEESGYYNHCRNFSVRAEEVEGVKKFLTRFKRGKSQIKEARRA